MSAENTAIAAGIDLGGSKIEACLFDRNWHVIRRDRVPTPGEYGEMIKAVAELAATMRGATSVPVGIGHPGVVNADTGAVLAANLPASGRNLAADLRAAIGGVVTTGNDTGYFALSEAVLGAARDAGSVVGLILGTGVAAGLVRDRRLWANPGSVAGEIGHMAAPATVITDHGLPVLDCGCGRRGCFETLISGPGLQHIHQHKTGVVAGPKEIFAEDGPAVEIWYQAVSEFLVAVHLNHDPEVVVIGGGLSNAPDLISRLIPRLAKATLAYTRPPGLLLAEFGSSSGVRGAAYAAWREAGGDG